MHDLPLRAARVERGLTQTELARRAGTSQSAVARIEAGHTSPTVDTLTRIAAALGMTLALEPSGPDTGVDPTLVAANLRLSPAQRLRKMAQASRSVERMRAAARAAA
jgi:transcriptional regulator with XRE-family HTH domain